MKTKFRHNKKRNTAFLFETLVKELTKASISGDTEGKVEITSMIKEHFASGTLLGKELELYRNFQETYGVDRPVAERLLNETKREHLAIDLDELYGEQDVLLSKMSERLGKGVFSNFIVDYRNLASISQIFNRKTVSRERVVLEETIIRRMMGDKEVIDEGRVDHVDDLTFRTFTKSFNEEYGDKLLREQKDLLLTYMMAFSDDGISLKTYLNEEIGRLRDRVEGSMGDEIFDEVMKENMGKVLERLDSFRDVEVGEEMVEKVLQIQGLVGEIESDDS